MRTFIAIISVLFLPAVFSQNASESESVRFRAMDVVLDSGEKPLSAWQVEITGDLAHSKIVGVEGGDVEHYSKAPYYDPAALQGGRIIIAAFTTEEDAPAGRIRVARIHLAESGGGVPEYSARLIAAATRGGEQIDVPVELKRIGGK